MKNSNWENYFFFQIFQILFVGSWNFGHRIGSRSWVVPALVLAFERKEMIGEGDEGIVLEKCARWVSLFTDTLSPFPSPISKFEIQERARREGRRQETGRGREKEIEEGVSLRSLSLSRFEPLDPVPLFRWREKSEGEATTGEGFDRLFQGLYPILSLLFSASNVGQCGSRESFRFP